MAVHLLVTYPVSVMEVTGSKHRVWVSVIFHFGYGMSLFALPGLSLV
jgi:hypothetical protein